MARTSSEMADTARRAFVATLVVVGVVALALALWKLRLVLALLFLGVTLSAAMRPGVEALARRRVPRAVGVLVHYAALIGGLGLFLWLLVPLAVDQVQAALDQLPAEARGSTGFKHDLLTGLERRLEDLPRGSELVRPSLELTVQAFEALIGVFFVFATAAYWLFERERAIALVCALVGPSRRHVVRDTWHLVDLKLGSYVRGQGLLILLVGAALSLAFLVIGEPYWLLLGAFAGLVEIIPVIGPIAAGALAVGVGLTESVGVGFAAGLAVLVVRLLEDYLVLPRVLGDATGLSPLLVLVAVTSCGVLFGGFAVVLAVPFAALLATLVDVTMLDKDPRDAEVPTVLFPAKDAER
jgi:predicted PurR-regulated permease PerM